MEEINYLLAGLYGKNAARDIFESLCAVLLTADNKKISKEEISSQLNLKDISLHKSNLNKVKEVYHIDLRQEDGGLDILIENEDGTWEVYQCKFFIEGRIDNDSNRKEQVQNSFNRAFETAKSSNKSIVKWTLCLPKNFNDKEHKWWNNFKKDNSKEGLSIEHMLNVDILTIMLKYPEIYRYYFKREYENKREITVTEETMIRKYCEETIIAINGATNVDDTNRRTVSNLDGIELVIDKDTKLRKEYLNTYNDLSYIDYLIIESKKIYNDYYLPIKLTGNLEKIQLTADALNRRSHLIENVTKRNNVQEYMQFLKKRKEEGN